MNSSAIAAAALTACLAYTLPASANTFVSAYKPEYLNDLTIDGITYKIWRYEGKADLSTNYMSAWFYDSTSAPQRFATEQGKLQKTYANPPWLPLFAVEATTKYRTGYEPKSTAPYYTKYADIWYDKVYWFAASQSAIVAKYNGTPYNYSEYLVTLQQPVVSLLPAFEGGTLALSAANGATNYGNYTQNFTLDGSMSSVKDRNGQLIPSNTIDTNWQALATFSGAFSDKASGIPGSIQIVSPAGKPGTVIFAGTNTYTGLTTIGSQATLKVTGSLGDKSNLSLLDQGTYVVAASDTVNSVWSEATSIISIEAGQNLTIGGADGDSTIEGKISGSGGLSKAGTGIATLAGMNTYAGSTIVGNGELRVNGITSSETTIKPGATLSGTGTISGNVYNEGIVSPGRGPGNIGTLTVDGSYLSSAGPNKPSLNIEVNGSSSDRLIIKGDNRSVLLSGNLNIASAGTSLVSPGNIYTAIEVEGNNPAGGELDLTTNVNVVGASGLKLVRETDREFARLSPDAANYYKICTSTDPGIQQGCKKLQFAWLKLAPESLTPIPIQKTDTPGATTIQAVKGRGGAITTASSGSVATNNQTCTSNSGNAAKCQQINQPGTGAGAGNSNSVGTAKAIDAGWASVSAAVTSGVSGGSPIDSASGIQTGYTTKQTKAALVTPDFVNVVAALFAVPTRQQLNQALHSITAEPYASMQSVALEALEQFRANTLALTTGQRLPFIVEEQTCEAAEQPDPAVEKAPPQTENCKPVKRQKLTPWSLLIDGSNTQASLNGTNDLASLDYNIFSSSYGLQYDFNPQWSAGAAFGYGRANLYNYEYSNTRIDSDTYSGAAWGIYRPSEAWKFTALAGYMNLHYESDRNISFGGLNRNATANWSGNGFTTALAAEYDWILSGNKASRNAVRIKPSTYFSYALHNQGSFSESGAESLNLQVDSHTADSLIYGIGFTLETPIITGKTSRLIPRLAVGYEYDFNGDTSEEHQLTASFAEVPALGSIDVLGQNRGANAVDVALSLEYETSDTLSLYGNVGGAFWSNGNEVNYGGGLRVRW